MKTSPELDRRQVFYAYPLAGEAADRRLRFCPRCGDRCEIENVAGRDRSVCVWCRYVHYRNPAPGVAIVITEGDFVVLGRRRRAMCYGDYWAFPAGFVEYDEDFITAARREAREETGLEIEVTGILNVTSNHLAPELHAMVVALAGYPIGGVLEAGDDMDAVRWVSLGGPYPNLAYEADAELLAALARGDARSLPVDRRFARGRGFSSARR